MSNEKQQGGSNRGRRLSNFVGGRYVDTSDGSSAMLVDPSTGEEYLEAPVSAQGRRCGHELIGRGLPRVAGCHTIGAEPGPLPHRRRLGGPGRGPGASGVREHREAGCRHHGRGDPSAGRPDPVLRRRGPPDRGQVGRRVPQGPHVLHPPGAHRGVRSGNTVELPPDDGGVEVGARLLPPATPWCSSRRTPRRHPLC